MQSSRLNLKGSSWLFGLLFGDHLRNQFGQVGRFEIGLQLLSELVSKLCFFKIGVGCTFLRCEGTVPVDSKILLMLVRAGRSWLSLALKMSAGIRLRGKDLIGEDMISL